MSKAFQFLMQHKDRFLQVADFDGFNTRFSGAILLEHTPAMVLDMINHYKNLPELVVVNIRTSDLIRYTNSQQQANIRKMVILCKALTKQVIRSTDTFRGFFPDLMISLPWYVGWKSQCAGRRGRSHFNRCLASVACDHGCYIKATISQGLFDTSNPGDLTDVSLSMFLADIVLLIKQVYKPFQVAQEARQLLFCMSEALKLQNMDAAVKSLHIDG